MELTDFARIMMVLLAINIKISIQLKCVLEFNVLHQLLMNIKL